MAHTVGAARGTPVPPGFERAGFWRAVRQAVVRVIVVFVILAAIYTFAPLGRRFNGNVALELAAALLILVVVTSWEFRSVAQSQYPEIKAIEAVGVALPLVLLPFAAAYYVMAHEALTSFGTRLTRLDSLYFTVTTFATVGFGDITAKTQAARAVVTGQIVIDLLLIGFIGKALLGTAQRRRNTLSVTGDASRPSGDEAAQ